MSAHEIEELRRELALRDAFLAQACAGLRGCVERLALTGANVDELRSFARELAIIAGDDEARTPRRTEVDAGEQVTKAAATWRARTRDTVPIHVAFDGAADVIGSWDEDLLGAILGELISNACKYGGGRRVTVRVEADAATVSFVVEDEGHGLDENAAPARRFTRGRETSGTPGFGVGVWLTRLLAEAHGGTLRLERRAVAGTRAIVELPRGG